MKILVYVCLMLIVGFKVQAGSLVCAKSQSHKINWDLLQTSGALDDLYRKHNIFGKKSLQEVIRLGANDKVGFSVYRTALRIRSLKKYLKSLPEKGSRLGTIEALEIADKLEKLTFFMMEKEVTQDMNFTERRLFHESRLKIINEGLGSYLSIRNEIPELTGNIIKDVSKKAWFSFKNAQPTSWLGKIGQAVKLLALPRRNSPVLPYEAALYLAHFGTEALKEMPELYSPYQKDLYKKDSTNLIFRGWSYYLMLALIVVPTANVGIAGYQVAQAYPEEKQKVVDQLKETNKQVDRMTHSKNVQSDLDEQLIADSISALEEKYGRKLSPAEVKAVRDMVINKKDIAINAANGDQTAPAAAVDPADEEAPDLGGDEE